MLELFLISQQGHIGFEQLIWGCAACLLAVSVALFIYQHRVGRGLASELEQLGKVKKHNVEYELVLEVLKLCTWHIDVAGRTITYDTDYRGRSDCFMPAPGTSLDDLVAVMAKEDQARIRQALDDICAGRIEDYHEISRVRIAHSDKYYWTESYATVSARDTDGLPKTIVGTSQCIDERKHMESALVESRNKAEESDRLKTAFIANMSHEIRTPLNAIIGFTSVLSEVQNEDERRQLVELIQDNNQKLLHIIDNVMTISRIESGKEPLIKSTFELNELLQSLAASFTPQAQPGVAVSVKARAEQQLITTDMTRLMNVLEHLLSNAVKFTSKGSIILGYDVPVSKRISIWVSDTGKGLIEKHRERVFERFFKVDEYIPGTGLGLNISRMLVASMGGSISVKSKFGEGSTFRIDIPIA